MGMHCIVQMQCVPIFITEKSDSKRRSPYEREKLSRPPISLIVSIALIIVGIAGSFILQTNSGKTTIRTLPLNPNPVIPLRWMFIFRKTPPLKRLRPLFLYSMAETTTKKKCSTTALSSPAAAMLRSAWICTAWAKANLCRTPNGSPRAAAFMMRYATA